MAAAVLVACAAPGVASAQVVVNSNADNGDGVCDATQCTLREAITAGPPGEIHVPVETYLLTNGAISITRDVTIRGVGSGLPTISPDVGSPSRVFSVAASADVQLARLRISGGSALNNAGGGLLVAPTGSLVVEDSEVVGNRARSGGGIWSGGGLTVRRSLIAANEALSGDGPAQGAGIGLDAGLAVARIENSTISDNESDGWGGGVYTLRSLTLENVTIVDNFAPPRGVSETTGRGAGLAQEFANDPGAVTTARNVLMARNTNGSCGGTVNDPIDSANGLIDEPLPGTTCNAVGPGNLIVADAGVGPLGANGGPTRTHALLAGSPALNTGANCLAEDQRGIVRPQGAACDIGAYELVVQQEQPGPQPPSDTQDPEELPPPEAGETVNATPSGTVKVKLPGSNRFVDLSESQQLPVGTVVDVRKGRITLLAAGGQTATFYAGIFKIGQTKGARPLTTLTLVEKLTCPKAGNAVAAAKKKRRLWGDGKGRFRTKGKHSAATVVGTKWLVEDRCTSTLTRVVTGRVKVRDFVKKKTVTVRKGKRYIARANR